MIYDRNITISVGGGRKETNWIKKSMPLSALYDKLKNPVRGVESMREYLGLKKAVQDELKDVGGYIGGALNSPRRKSTNVTGRDLITLDFDNLPPGGTAVILAAVDSLGCNYCVHSTRKHTDAKPRLRVILPVDRTLTPDEYEPCARMAAQQIGLDMVDPTTFDICRLMYWPSCCADGDYVYVVGDKPLLAASSLLGQYADWRDVSSWPTVEGETNKHKLADKQGDPCDKKGTVGAFCRTYDVPAAIDEFLSDVYTPDDTTPDRYTYVAGSTTGGAITYEGGNFLFSHHATDPCSGRLVNAFDLVRMHKFGGLDADIKDDTPTNKLPSYTAMCDFASDDPKVRVTINHELQAQAAEDFAQFASETNTEITETNTDDSWSDELERGKNMVLQDTISNALIILGGDPQLKGKFALNEFAGRGEVLHSVPWNKSKKRRLWDDTDNNGLYWYLEKFWGLKNRRNIDSALDLHATEHAFNEVQNYIDGLKWDNTPRLDTLFVDFLGAEDSPYTRAVTRKMLVAAIARAMIPGCKFDSMLILSGRQGIGKSTILDRISRGFFNDSIRSFEGKEASELLQGVWIVEVSELDAFRRSDVSRIKQFLSLRADRYRAAYGRHVKELPRKCVFFGSTNNSEFLQDTTGNRRFWPVDVGITEPTKNLWTEFTEDYIAQVWAEAKIRWQVGEKLYLCGELERIAQEHQEAHREESPQEGIIRDFVERPVPIEWKDMGIDQRRNWLNMPNDKDKVAHRDRICAQEIWCELYGKNQSYMKRQDTIEINSVLSRMPGWKRAKNGVRYGMYGKQKGYVYETK